MRSLTADQDVLWDLSDRGIHLRVYVEDADGDWRNLSDLEGQDWVLSADWGGDIDAPIRDASVRLKRSHRDHSLAPEKANAKLNRKTSDGTFGPLLAPRRSLKIEVAATARGLTPQSGDWIEAFSGQIDAVDSGKRGEVEVKASDHGMALMQAFIEDDDRVYGDPAGSPVETEMQQILNHAAASWGAPSVTLYTPTSPGWNILDYNAESGPVLDELVRLAAQIGWVIRYRWDSGTSTWRLTLFDPDRTNTTPAMTLPVAAILSVNRSAVDISTIRNVVRVRYTDATITPDDADATNGRRSVTRVDSTSISLYGRRFMEVAEGASSQIDTSAEATTFADAILSDLKDPVTGYDAKIRFDVRPEIHDLVRFKSDGTTRDTDLDLGVVRIRHSVTGEAATTSIAGRGAASAGFGRTWRDLEAGPGRARPGSEHSPPAIAAGWSDVTFPGGVTVEAPTPAQTPRGRRWKFWEVFRGATAGFALSSTTLAARGSEASFDLVGPPGETEYVKIVGVDVDANRDTSPANEKSVTYGQGGASLLHPDANWAGQFIARGFDVITRGGSYPPDMWHMTGGVWGADAQQTTTAESGNQSLELSTPNAALRSNYIPIRPSVPYRFEIRWQGQATLAARVFEAKVEWHSDKGTVVRTDTIVSAIPTAPNTWQTDALRATAPATARWARLTLGLKGSGHTDTVTIDTIEWEQIFQRFSAYHSSTQSLGNAVWTLMEFDTEDFDLGGIYDGTDTFTAPVDGVYSLNAGAQMTEVDLYCGLAVYLNGSEIAVDARDSANHQGEINGRLTVTRLGLELSAGDTLKVYGRGDDSTNIPTATAGRAGAWFSVERVA